VTSVSKIQVVLLILYLAQVILLVAYLAPIVLLVLCLAQVVRLVLYLAHHVGATNQPKLMLAICHHRLSNIRLFFINFIDGINVPYKLTELVSAQSSVLSRLKN